MHWIDPDCLPKISSTVERFLFNPHGEADGMLLANGRLAHFPPHMSKQVLRHVRSGERVTLYGVKPKGVDIIACVAVENAAGKRIDDTGPPPKHKKKGAAKHKERAGDPVELEGTIERTLHGPKGETRGVLLGGGEIVRFPPHVARERAKLLKPGATLAVRGLARRLDSAAIEAVALGSSRRTLRRFEPAHD